MHKPSINFIHNLNPHHESGLIQFLNLRRLKLSEQKIVYIMDCTDGSTFVGMTANLEQALVQHFNGNVVETEGRIPIGIRCYIAINNERNALWLMKFLRSLPGRFILRFNWI